LTDKLLVTRDAAFLLGITAETLSNWRQSGNGPTYIAMQPNAKPDVPRKRGRPAGQPLIRYRLSDLQAFLARHVKKTTHRTRITYSPSYRDRPTRIGKPKSKVCETIGLDDCIKALFDACDAAGGIGRWSTMNEVYPVHIYEMIHGRMLINPRIAMLLGYDYEIIVRYRKRK
jgi:hypothetical protein